MVTRSALLRATAVVNALDLAILVILFAYRGWPVAVFALGGLLVSAGYAAPPLRLKDRGLGELGVFLVWGPLMVGGTYYAAVGRLPWEVVVASVPYALLVTTVLIGKHIDKLPWDAGLGIRSLPAVLGEARARRLNLALMVAFYGAVGALVAVRALPYPALASFLGVERLVRVWPYLLRPRPAEPPANYPVWPLWYTAAAFLHTRRAGALFVLGLAVAAALPR